jgi:formylglycine-generating enzyme required for sulfatase activity
LAIRDLRDTFGQAYPRGDEFLGRLEILQTKQAEISKQEGRLQSGDLSEEERAQVARQFQELQAEALLANPRLDFSQLLVVRRRAQQLGLPANYLGNSSLPPTGYDNQIAILSPIRPGGTLIPLYQPPRGEFVGDVRLDYDAQRLMFSMPNNAGRWRVCELNIDGSGLRELALIDEPDVDNYDACYLPDGRIVFSSTACFAGIPCVNGEGHVANLYLRERSGAIRQLTVEQDHDWCPTVLNNGRLLYLRWEYTDLPHAFSRILFHMNPDGTEQMEYYGSSSYWPSAMFYARPIPNHATKVVAVVGGHHGSPRMGELVIFDPARGRREAQGAVQRIPGHGQRVDPAVLDMPVDHRWPRFLHPYPLSDKHFLVSCQPHENGLWGIYLVDTFDNAVRLAEEPGYAMFEPIPLRATPRPPSIPDKVDLERQDADVLIADIYRGEGLRGVPRGAIKSLRVMGYHFAYQGMGAEPYSVGMDGPWDPKRILGTVPVEADGSAHFRVPAYTPIALQPLDAAGRAVQLMRSWFTAMPGEVVSCVGCHEPQNTAPPVRQSLAANRPPAEIKPWYGPARGFAFRREVQPVLDRHCTGCHDGQPQADGRRLYSFVDGENAPVQSNANRHNQEARFSPSYYQLRRFVRTPSKESDMHMLRPWEYHASTTRLIQLLQKGHYDVPLDPEAWDRLVTWIDLNAPFHGNWFDIRGDEIGDLVQHQSERRAAMRQRYAGTDGEPEETPVERTRANRERGAETILAADGEPSLARRRDAPASLALRANGAESETRGDDSLAIPLAAEIRLELVRIPAGQFVMGQEDGCADERPAARMTIDRPFWMGRFEVTNEQFALFDPTHDSRWENNDFIKFGPGELGWTLARPKQPVVRVSWTQATAFCGWLSQKTGRPFRLPTEAQWEYACRAGTATPLWYGTVDDDFSSVANVSDLSHQAIDPFGDPNRPAVIAPWRPADTRYDDHCRVSAPVGSYRPNPWGLFDMHGNVAEWTRSEYRPYPIDGDDPNDRTDAKRVVRGGSWYDPPPRCRAAFRQAYRADQPVYDVGFRVICE